MPPSQRLRKMRWINWGALVGVVLTILVARVLTLGHLQGEPLGAPLINLSYDLPFGFRKHIHPQEAVIVYMDEESHRQLKQSTRQAWDRGVHAQLIRNLTARGAKVIAFDITFFQPSNAETDAAFAAAMKAHGKIVIGSLLEAGTVDGSTERISLRDSEVFRDTASSGLVNLEIDSGNFVRRAFQVPPNIGIEASTLPEKAAELAGFPINPRSRGAEWLNFYGPGGGLPWTSYHLALGEGTPPDFFRGKVVFVGFRNAVGVSDEVRDNFDSPYTRWDKEPIWGVEIHATRFLNLIRGDGLTRLPPRWEMLIFGLLGIVFGLGFTLVRPLIALALALGAVVLVIGASFLAFKSGVWWAWMIAAGVQIPCALAWAVTYNTVRLKIESKTLERCLALHLSPQRARQILYHPELLGLGAERHEISILFSDIANFSSITGRMHPEDLFKLLNKYFETALSCVHKTDGTVVKLIGDAIFAIWNAPFPQENHPRQAIQAALAMRDQLVQFDAVQQSLPLQTRIGLHLGDAFVGNVGSTERFDYTAIGDSINLASRLEGLNKYLGTCLLASRDIQRMVTEDFSSRLVGHFIFKGLERPVEVHEILGPPGENLPWKKEFAEALFSFQRKNFEAAITAFRKTIALRKSDGPSEFYLAQIEKMDKTLLPENWAGEIRLNDK